MKLAMGPMSAAQKNQNQSLAHHPTPPTWPRTPTTGVYVSVKVDARHAIGHASVLISTNTTGPPPERALVAPRTFASDVVLGAALKSGSRGVTVP